MQKKYFLNDIQSLQIKIKSPSVIFLYGDLWAWKTTLSKHILQNIVWVESDITSPTYTYYNRYWNNYHFDLYRIESYDEFFSIWWEEILENNTWIILVEWAEKIDKYWTPDIKIWLKKTNNEDEREIEISTLSW